MGELKSISLLESFSLSARCVKNELGVNRGSGEDSWKAFAEVQTRDSCGLDCDGDTGDGESGSVVDTLWRQEQ